MALIVENLSLNIGSKQVVQGTSLTVKSGEVVALMGPNGSGKSSLAMGLMGHPNYLNDGSTGETKIEIDGISLADKTPDERAKLGLYLAMQYPVSIPGVTVRELLLSVLRGRGEKTSALDLKKEIEKIAARLKIKEELLKRGINEDFSGGEKKKMEILQMVLLKPKYAILDETDSGLDIDALKIVAEGVVEAVSSFGVGVLVITHYRRLLDYLKPNRVLVMKNGKIVEEGGNELIKRLEDSGYQEV